MENSKTFLKEIDPVKPDQPTSSTVAHISYCEKSESLTVEFHNKRVYEYYHVPKETWTLAYEAESISKFLHASVFKIFKYKDITVN